MFFFISAQRHQIFNILVIIRYIHTNFEHPLQLNLGITETIFENLQFLFQAFFAEICPICCTNEQSIFISVLFSCLPPTYVSWYLGILVSCYLAILVSWYLGILVSWYLYPITTILSGSTLFSIFITSRQTYNCNLAHLTSKEWMMKRTYWVNLIFQILILSTYEGIQNLNSFISR